MRDPGWAVMDAFQPHSDASVLPPRVPLPLAWKQATIQEGPRCFYWRHHRHPVLFVSATPSLSVDTAWQSGTEQIELGSSLLVPVDLPNP